MKSGLITLLIILGLCRNAASQTAMIEYYRDSLRKSTVDSNKAYCLYLLSYYYQNSNPDSALSLAQSAFALSQKSHFLRGQIGALGQIAAAFNRLGNYSTALQKYIEQLKLIETTKDSYDIASAYLRIALVYNSQKDANKALYYAHKADSIAVLIAGEYPDFRLYTTLDIGEIYSTNNQLDSASYYTNVCYHESIRLDTVMQRLKKPGTYSLTGTALNNMGNIYFKKGNYNEALMYFQNSIHYLDSMQDDNTLAECYYGIAQCFSKNNLPDSALSYARRSYAIATENKFLKHALDGSYLLATLYKKKNNLDSAFAFQETFIALKDSFDNAEKIKELQRLTTTEQMRQDQREKDLEQQTKDRRLTLELLLVGIFIPILFFMTAFISGKRVNKTVIKYSGIFSLLFLFEYITLLLHPWVVEKAGHSPIYEIIIFVAIAALISPIHHRIETWLIGRLAKRHQTRMEKARAAKLAAEATRAAAEASKIKAEKEKQEIKD